jgi:hypothetical protein
LSFDDLFSLLILVIFIGIPLLNRMRGSGRPTPPPGRPMGAPQPGQGRPVAGPGPTAAGPRPTDGEDDGDEFFRRLEEARRRVREAMGESGDVRDTTSSDRPLFSDRPLISTPAAGRTVADAGIPSGRA